MIWSMNADCQRWGSWWYGVPVLGVGVIRSVKNRCASDGWRHDLKTALHD